MTHHQPRRVWPAAAGLILLLGACTAAASPSYAPTSEMPMDSAMGSMAEHADFDFGMPAEAADADRVVEIAARDEFRFDPAEVEVASGETVTFQVTNVGVITHEFVLGDEAVQEEHEREMAEGMEMGDEPNAISIDAGATGELTWTFTEPGELIFGCHEPGHYDAGMVGVLIVVSS